jgi:hypothetical protein
MSESFSYPRESVELVGPDIRVDKVLFTDVTKVQLCIMTTAAVRPSGWQAAVAIGPDIGLMIGPGTANVLTPGTYWMWYKVTSTPELPARQVNPPFKIT